MSIRVLEILHKPESTGIFSDSLCQAYSRSVAALSPRRLLTRDIDLRYAIRCMQALGMRMHLLTASDSHIRAFYEQNRSEI
jgi:hypothetical protein